MYTAGHVNKTFNTLSLSQENGRPSYPGNRFVPNVRRSSKLRAQLPLRQSAVGTRGRRKGEKQPLGKKPPATVKVVVVGRQRNNVRQMRARAESQ